MKILTKLTLFHTLHQILASHNPAPNARYLKLKELLNEQLNLDELFEDSDAISQFGIGNSRENEEDLERSREYKSSRPSGQITLAKPNPIAAAEASRSCLSMCAINKEFRQQCTGNPTTPYDCKRRGCCFDNEDKACYRPAKSYCPRPRCEAVEISERVECDNPSGTLRGCLALAPTCCWDHRNKSCFKKAEVQCPAVYKPEVTAEDICGWKRISKPQCLAKKECCWNDQAGFCVHAVKNETQILNDFISSQLEKQQTTTLSPATTTTANSKDSIIQDTNTPTAIAATTTTTQKPEIQQPLVEEIDFDKIEENFNKVLENYVNSQLGRPYENLYPNATHMCPNTSNLEQAELCGESLEKTDCLMRKCCFVNIFEDMSACFHPIEKIDNEDGEHSIFTNPNPYPEVMTSDQFYTNEIQKTIKSGSNNLNFISNTEASSSLNIPTISQVNFNTEMDIILANREAKNRCEMQFPDTQTKNYKRCVLYYMPNILDTIKEAIQEPNNDLILRQKADADLASFLTTACFSKMESFELCKILALSGRPLKKDPSKPEGGFNLDLLQSYDGSGNLLQNLFSADMDKDDLLTILMAGGPNTDFNILMRKLAAIKSSESLETEVMTRLLTDFNSDIDLGMVMVAPGPRNDCYDTLLVGFGASYK